MSDGRRTRRRRDDRPLHPQRSLRRRRAELPRDGVDLADVGWHWAVHRRADSQASVGDSAMTTKSQLLSLLRELAASGDTEEAHIKADEALLKFINDEQITEGYFAISRWYA